MDGLSGAACFDTGVEGGSDEGFISRSPERRRMGQGLRYGRQEALVVTYVERLAMDASPH